MKKLTKLYQQIVDDNSCLIQSDKILQIQMQENLSFFQHSFVIIQDQNNSKKIRYFVLSVVKYFLNWYWPSAYISNVQKQQILDSILKLLSNTAIDQHICKTIGEILGLVSNQKNNKLLLDEFWDNYLSSFNSIQDKELFLLVIIEYLKVDQNNSYLNIGKFLEFFAQVFTQQKLAVKDREMIIAVNYLCLYNLNRQDQLSENDIARIVEPNLQNWIKYYSMILSVYKDLYLPSQIYVLRSLSILFRDFKSISSSIIQDIFQHVFKLFMYLTQKYIQQEVFSYQPINTKDQVSYMIEGNFFFQSNLQEIIVCQLELLNSLCYFADFNEYFDFVLYPILWNVSHLTLMTKEQEQLWNFEDYQYIEENEFNDQDINIQCFAKECINNFIEKFDKKAIDIIKEIIDYFLKDGKKDDQFIKKKFTNLIKPFNNINIKLKKLEYKPEKIFNKQYDKFNWKRKEAALNLLGYFLKDLSGDCQQQQQSNENDYLEILTQILKNEPQLILRGRCIYCVSQMRFLYDLDNQNFSEIYKNVLKNLQDTNPLSIQLCASKAITILSFKISKKNMQNQLSSILNQDIQRAFLSAIQLLNLETQNTNILILDNILSFYDIQPSIIDQHTNLNLLNQYLNIYQNLENSMMLCSLIQDILKRILRNQKQGQSLLNILVRYLSKFLTLYNNGVDQNEHLTNLMDLLIFSVECNLEMDYFFQLKDLIIELNKQCTESRVINKITILVKNLLIKKNYQQKYQAYLEQLIQSLLTNQLSVKSEESRSIYCGNLLLIYIEFHKEILNKKLIEAVITKVNKCSLPSTNQGFIIFFAYQFLKNFEQMENIFQNMQIDTKFGFKILLDHWLLHQPKFIGPYTKSLTINMLINLFKFGNSQTQNIYVIGFKPSHNKRSPELKLPIKIISILVEILQHEEQIEKQKKNKLLDTEQRTAKYIEECRNNQRMETEFDEDEYEDNSMEVELKVESDDEELMFNSKNSGGFGAVETGSQSYLSGLMGFDDYDNNEFDESTENDLKFLQIQKIDIKESIKDFLQKFIKNKNYVQSLDRQTQQYLVKICNQFFQSILNFEFIIQKNEPTESISRYTQRIFQRFFKRFFFNKIPAIITKKCSKLFVKI